MPLWDNARWIAITLVVIGHGILPLIAEDDVAYSVYLFIYSFHVAVFVTVAGYFARSGPPNARALRQILTDIVFPFFIFETIWTVIRWVLGGSFELDYTTASWTLWFLIALAIWRIVLPVPRAAALPAAHRDRDLDRRGLHRDDRRDARPLAHPRDAAVLRVRLEAAPVAAHRPLARPAVAGRVALARRRHRALRRGARW